MIDYADPANSLRKYYSRSLSADSKRLHFAAHSHHLWPDCTRDAHLKAWDDSAQFADEKYGAWFAQAAQARAHLARLVGGASAEQFVLGSNTHEFLVRILSCATPGEPFRVLTTDGEFHSFSRQMRRCEEVPGFTVERVPVEPFETFPKRWAAACKHGCDFAYLSHVFFNSGYALSDLPIFVDPLPTSATVVVDGYHAVCAIPVSIEGLQKRIFYVGGGYKYAQAGEGACYLYVPEENQSRPLNTGWFASFGALEKGEAKVTYDRGGARFAGATFDFTATYRFNAVQNWWNSIGLTVNAVHGRVQALKAQFVQEIDQAGLRTLRSDQLLKCNGQTLDGHFLAFRLPNAVALAEKLKSEKIVVDARADRLRFGFGLYHDREMVSQLVERLKNGGY